MGIDILEVIVSMCCLMKPMSMRRSIKLIRIEFFFADVGRPMRFKPVGKLNNQVIDHLLKASSSQNDETEKVGLLNSAFEKAVASELILESSESGICRYIAGSNI
jgi:hypothetical protein